MLCFYRCLSVHGGGGGLSQHALQVVSQHALQQWGGIPACIVGDIPVCLAAGGWWWGVSRLTPMGGLQAHTQTGGFPGPHQGVSRPTPRWVSRPTPRECIPSCTEADPPPSRGRLLPRAVRILLECILV